MLYLETSSNNFTIWNGEPIDGITHPKNINNLWTEEELAQINLFEPDSPEEPEQDWVTKAGKHVERDGEVVKFVYDLEVIPLQEYKDQKLKSIIRSLDRIANKILRSYPEAEVEGWLAKEAEARAFMALAEESRTSDSAPLLKGVVTFQFTGQSLTEEEYLTHITSKAEKVIEKANEWRTLSAFTEGMRSKANEAFSAAENHSTVSTVYEGIIQAIEAAAGQYS